VTFDSFVAFFAAVGFLTGLWSFVQMVIWVVKRLGGGVPLGTFVYERTDGRWIAEVPELPGVMVYGATQGEALKSAGRLLTLLRKRESESEGSEKS
jgi:predicted RNase H-like HicB family nuclease